VSVYLPSAEGPSAPMQAREHSPNPRWPQDGQVESLVVRARAIIARNPHALRDIRSPVTAVVADMVGDGCLGMYVVEGALADSARRLTLNVAGLHCVGLAWQEGVKP
jgi:hypothetical protein